MLNSPQRLNLQIALALFVVAAAGCSKPAGTAVSGHVTYKGKSVSGASLAFYPATGRAVTTVVDADGNYATNLPAGDYGATVIIGAELPHGWKEGDPIPAQKMTLPMQYSKRIQTPLKATVSPGQSEPINFELE